MKISDVIKRVKEGTLGMLEGQPIDPQTTRDQLLFGELARECTGIVLSMWPSVSVLRRAVDLGSNLIISHEALFWNHGDHTEWLESSHNGVYLQKKQYLDEHQLTVWRAHDYLHSGILLAPKTYQDGIFWGFAKAMGWSQVTYRDESMLLTARLTGTQTAAEIARAMRTKFNLAGVRLLGDPQTSVKKIGVIPHVTGDANTIITQIDQEAFDLILSMEIVDYTLSEYIREAAQLGEAKAMISIGHFNLEEIGLSALVDFFRAVVGADMPLHFVQSGDMYHYR